MGDAPRAAWFIAIVVATCATLPVSSARADESPLETSDTRFVLLTDSQKGPDGSTRWLGPGSVLQGLVRTNGAFAFAGSPVFTDTVSSDAEFATWFNGGSPIDLASDHNGSADVPAFANGFVRGVPIIPLPTDAYPQQGMALRRYPLASAPTNVMINTYCSGAYPAGTGVSGNSTPPNGIYVSHDASGPIGIYVKGDLTSVRIWPSDTVQYGMQWLQFQQGSRVKTILLINGGAEAVAWNGANTSGIPADDYVGSTSAFAGVIYVDGAINDLRGPDRLGATTVPAIDGSSRLLVVAHDDIVIQRDITCRSFATSTNVLGIMSATGNVRIGTSAPDDCRLDAFVMATGSTGEFTVDNFDTGAPRGAIHLRGGSVSRFFGAFGTYSSPLGPPVTGYAREFVHDDRGVIPPAFPTFLPGPVLDAPANPLVAAPEGLQVSPDPARTELTCRFSLPRAGRVRIELLDVGGRRVASLFDGTQSAGDGAIRWSRGAGTIATIRAGLYFVRMYAGRQTSTARVVLLD